MNRLDRLYGLTVLLQSRRGMAIEKLAEHFGISTRTAYRDLSALTEAGVPVAHDARRGYYITEGYYLRPVALTTPEANALLMMQPLVQRLADRSVAADFARALEKVRAVMKPEQLQVLDEMLKTVSWQLPDCMDENYSYLALLQQAIFNQNEVWLRYADRSETLTERVVEPLGVVYYAMHWHLLAWCRLRNDYRDFRLARVQALQAGPGAFDRHRHVPFRELLERLHVEF